MIRARQNAGSSTVQNLHPLTVSRLEQRFFQHFRTVPSKGQKGRLSMEKDLVETFLAVAKAQNISKASRLLFVSQATVSYRLKSLEKQVGTELVQRSKGIRATRLTENGRRLLPLAQNWLQANEAFESFSPQP